jgi:hypothetical protein
VSEAPTLSDFDRSDRAQQLGLSLEREISDLVEEERAFVGALEASFLLLQRTGERALLVAEELALDEVLRDGGAVELDEGFSARFERRWMASATRSLPDPFSPVTRTLACEGAARWMSAIRRWVPALTQDAERVDRIPGGLGVPQGGDVSRLSDHVEQSLGVDRLFDEVERAALERLDRGCRSCSRPTP